MSVLVNGSATKDFKVQRGLRQGDPISPFLFVIAMEGLSALMKKSVEVRDFKPFKFVEEDYVDILQFADDTVIIGEPTCDNLWSMKVLLRGFELGLFRLNSLVFGLEKVLVRRVWKDVVTNIKSRLSMWKGRNISIGGRMTLIGSVLNVIPIFTLSFFKSPSKIIQEIRGLLSNFLWNGNVNKRCIHWVKWENVCKPRGKGGLGIRDVGEMNRSLLLKWKWRILKEDKATWSRFLLLRYQNPKIKVLASCVDVLNQDDSSWWRDIIFNDFKEEDSVEGFNDWHSCWLGDQTLHASFSHLFDLSTNKLCKVSDVITWNNGAYSWNIYVLFGIDGLLPLGPNFFQPASNGIVSVFDLQLRDLKSVIEWHCLEQLGK
ncbi:uncharacterized protein LOC131619813 [Vicia villosa]|uniref:uncharacterized protein LOC131619813 n=1 Tax=Vicia villosa TaxID=3911 RepID=UPI00273CD085|nr:uncharacterized protein LOC131619813 [Vicia villosa]